MPSSQLPQARTRGLIVESLPGELLVYDEERDRAHCLNEAAAYVWSRCDGTCSASGIAASMEKDLRIASGKEVVALALEALRKAHLLETGVHPPPGRGMTRRELSRRLGIAFALLPAVVSIVAPEPAHAASCLPFGQCCNTKSDCCPGLNCSGPFAGCGSSSKRCT